MRAANEYLESEYLPDHNRRFAHAAASPEDYHHQKPSRAALDEVFRLETERVIGNDWVVRYENRFLQVNRQGNRQAPAKGKVAVCEWEDGRVEIRYRGQKVSWEEIAERPQPAEWTGRARWPYPYGGTPPTAAIRGNNATTGCRRRARRSGRPGRRKLFWRLPALRPKRSAYGLAGLRAGVAKTIGREPAKRDISNEVRQGTF